MRIRNFGLTATEVIDSVADGEYLWLALEEPVLQKVSIYDPTQVLFEFTLTPAYGVVSKITKLEIYGSYIYCLLEASSQQYRSGLDYVTAQPMVVRFTKETPLTTTAQYSYWTDSSAVTYPTAPGELPSDFTVISTTDIRVLIPGEASGEVSKIYKFAGTSYSTANDITVTGVSYARNITNDGTNMWIATYEQPSTLVKVTTGGVLSTWTIQEG